MIFTPYKDFELGLSEYKVLALSFNASSKTVGVYIYVYIMPPSIYIYSGAGSSYSRGNTGNREQLLAKI